RLVVMSATLDVRAVTAHLECDALEAAGRTFPVETTHLAPLARQPCWATAAAALDDLTARQDTGDVLVFMPGIYEIRRTIEACRQRLGARSPLRFHALHGGLTGREQDEAVESGPQRRVIVSTNVAETSITIEGVRHVIDSGLARIDRFDPRRGINTLHVEQISQASADQRAGRAGRTAPGTCVRLWSAHERREAFTAAQIRRIDLAESLLRIRSMGIAPADFPWLESPPGAALDEAGRLLRDLGALDEGVALTDTGRAMARLPMHPRLSRMILEAAQRGCLGRALTWAALISEPDILARPVRRRYHEPAPDDVSSDLVVRERALETAVRRRFDPSACREQGLNAGACRDVERTRRQYLRLCRSGAGTNATDSAERAAGSTRDLVSSLLRGFPDHVALRRREGDLGCSMVGQKRVVLDRDSAVRRAGLLVAVEVREVGGGRELKTVLSLATAVEPAWLEHIMPERIDEVAEAAWNPQRRAVEQVAARRFDGLVFESKARPDCDAARAAEILVELIESGELALDRWNEEVDQWIARTRCVARWFPERGVITYEPDDLRVILLEIVDGCSRASQLRGLDCMSHVRNALSWPDQQLVEQMAPTKIALPSGRRMKIEYAADHAPRGRALIQDLFDLKQTPRIAGGREKLVLEILGPHHRPLQVTDDLERFWRELYPKLRTELRRRYPKHKWR
ncbi:MAG: helicase, partial [Phycisphaeraceae bacterium]|nr:helicase [Phycisphaeraceae bacterium]